MAETLTYVDRCQPLEEADSLPFLNLSISSYSAALPAVRAIASSTHLKEARLALEGDDEGVGLLCRAAILPNVSIEALRLDLKECSDGGIEQVADVLTAKRNLKQLSLQLNNVGQEGAVHLAKVLCNPSLEEFSIYATQLDLHDRCIGDRGVSILCGTMLQWSSSLRTLCVAQNGITREGVGHIIDALHSNVTVTTLDLSSNRIDSEGALLLAEHLQAACCVLKVVVLDGNHEIGNDGAKAIALALCGNSTLRTLGLRSCGIGRMGAERFATTLSQNQTLQELVLRGNVDVGDNAVEMISRGLKANASLLQLDLSSCGVGDEGCAYLADALMHNQMLHSLQLHRNHIGDGGLVALAETLRKKSYVPQFSVGRIFRDGKKPKTNPAGANLPSIPNLF